MNENRKSAYDFEFYDQRELNMSRSASIVVPLICDLLSPESVVDFGCGEGGWLAEFQNAGVKSILGLDGDYIDISRLRISKDFFKAIDLSKSVTIEKKFSLAMSLEVAEHLPESSAEGFVYALTTVSDAVIFSAAIPFQGGTNHINLQWQQFWCDLFLKRGYRMLDVIRPQIWGNENVSFWYRQNMMLFVTEGYLMKNPRLSAIANKPTKSLISVVDPEFLTITANCVTERQLKKLTLGQVIPHLPGIVLRSVLNRLGVMKTSLLFSKK